MLDVEADAAAGSNGKIGARLKARSAQGTLQIDTGEESPYTSIYRDAEVSARYGGETASADVRVGLAEGHAQGRVEVTLRGKTIDDYPLAGELDLAVPDITFINALSTELNATGGFRRREARAAGQRGRTAPER